MEELTKLAVKCLVDAKKKEKQANETEIENMQKQVERLMARNAVLDTEISAIEIDIPKPTAVAIEPLVMEK